MVFCGGYFLGSLSKQVHFTETLKSITQRTVNIGEGSRASSGSDDHLAVPGSAILSPSTTSKPLVLPPATVQPAASPDKGEQQPAAEAKPTPVPRRSGAQYQFAPLKPHWKEVEVGC